MSFRRFVYLLRTDLNRHAGTTGTMPFLRHFAFNPGFKYSVCLRVTIYLQENRLFRHSILYLSRLVLIHYGVMYGIDIPPAAKIGSGLHLLHFGGIVVHPNSTVGDNCTISQGVTLGYVYRGKRTGCPTIGDSVFIGPGAKILGNIRIGNNVVIGANSVVTKDIPDNAVVAGVPARILSYDGSEGYIANILGQH